MNEDVCVVELTKFPSSLQTSFKPQQMFKELHVLLITTDSVLNTDHQSIELQLLVNI